MPLRITYPLALLTYFLFKSIDGKIDYQHQILSYLPRARAMPVRSDVDFFLLTKIPAHTQHNRGRKWGREGMEKGSAGLLFINSVPPLVPYRANLSLSLPVRCDRLALTLSL